MVFELQAHIQARIRRKVRPIYVALIVKSVLPKIRGLKGIQVTYRL